MSILSALGKACGQDFDNDFTVEPCVAGAPDFAHPACAQRREEFVGAHLCGSAQSHFFTLAAQLTDTVSGAFGSVFTNALIRNRFPSAVTA